MRHQSAQYTTHYENVLGTSFELQVVAASASAARHAEEAALRETDRLDAILTGYAPDSELAAWLAAPPDPTRVSPELAEVLAAAEAWRLRTNGAFNPAVRAIGDALQTDVSLARLTHLIVDLRQPLWEVDRCRGNAQRLTPLAVSLDGLAKGYIVQRAATAASQVSGVSAVLLNVGGDIQHVGSAPVRVGLANPFNSAENAEPLEVIALRGEALATSGGYRRGIHIGGEWHSHILDPRTGLPVTRVVSASVFAPDCMTADALSTACSVLEPREAVALIDSVPGAGCLLVEAHGTITASARWTQRTHHVNANRAVS